MKIELTDILICDQCGGEFLAEGDSHLACQACGRQVPLQDGKPLFTQPSGEIVPSEKRERAPDKGTAWRRANWRFLQQEIERLAADAMILDVGSGRGDFGALMAGRRCLALEVYPYPETDVVCDLTQCNPVRPASFDAILLANVLEHVYDGQALVASLSAMLKPGGVLLVAVPFLLKVHQAPVDYLRFTHFALERLGADHGLDTERIEGVYDAAALVGEGLNNLRFWVLPKQPLLKRSLGRLLLALQRGLLGLMALLLPGTRVANPHTAISPAALGYHVVYRQR